jgi:rod shape-determining protein MreC
LDGENEKLLLENQRLLEILINKTPPNTVNIDTTDIRYTIVPGQVIRNSYANQRNYVTINKGQEDGIEQDMGVITDMGILGIIENTSNKFATVQSILNENSNINAKIKNTAHFGSLIWDTKTYNVVQLIDVPKLVPLMVGDTIVTGAMSSIFPENIPIGTIKKFDLDNSKSFYRLDVQLFNDMTNLKNVYIINNINRKEILELETATTTNE